MPAQLSPVTAPGSGSCQIGGHFVHLDVRPATYGLDSMQLAEVEVPGIGLVLRSSDLAESLD